MTIPHAESRRTNAGSQGVSHSLHSLTDPDFSTRVNVPRETFEARVFRLLSVAESGSNGHFRPALTWLRHCANSVRARSEIAEHALQILGKSGTIYRHRYGVRPDADIAFHTLHDTIEFLTLRECREESYTDHAGRRASRPCTHGSRSFGCARAGLRAEYSYREFQRQMAMAENHA